MAEADRTVPGPARARDGEPGTATGARIWDLPLRLFHWALALAVGVSLYTGLTGGFEEMDWHQRSGYLVLGLIAFRLLWGFFGTRYARFGSFLRGPGPVFSWARGALRRSPPNVIGHNPLAGWTIVLLLLALGVQAVTGLFSSDDLFVEGPLTHLVEGETVSLATSIHRWGQWTVGGLVALHLVALLVHRFLFGERIILAMITGRRRDAPAAAGIRSNRLPAALVLAAAVGAAVWWILFRL